MESKYIIHRFIMSSPSNIVGEYKSDNLKVSIIFNRKKSLLEKTQHFYNVTFRTKNLYFGDEYLKIFPDYSYTCDFICMCVSILYGKVIYNHGLVESNNIFYQPDMTTHLFTDYDDYIYSDIARSDLDIRLNLENIKLIEPIIMTNNVNSQILIPFMNAARFYWRALHNLEKEPELAFIDLVSCGESLTSGYTFDKEELIKHDTELCSILEIIDNEEISIKTKKKICNFMKNRLYQVKRKYILTIMKSLNDNFFDVNETKDNFGLGKIIKENIEKNISATYDLRSKYVHEGLNLGEHIKELSSWKNEVYLSALESKEFKNTFTLHGLERVMRYCLLMYIHNQMKINIHDNLCIK